MKISFTRILTLFKDEFSTNILSRKDITSLSFCSLYQIALASFRIVKAKLSTFKSKVPKGFYSKSSKGISGKVRIFCCFMIVQCLDCSMRDMFNCTSIQERYSQNDEKNLISHHISLISINVF